MAEIASVLEPSPLRRTALYLLVLALASEQLQHFTAARGAGLEDLWSDVVGIAALRPSLMLDARLDDIVSNDSRIEYDRARYSLGLQWQQL